MAFGLFAISKKTTSFLFYMLLKRIFSEYTLKVPANPLFSLLEKWCVVSWHVEVVSLDEKSVKCPMCGCQQVYKDGIRHTRHGEVQRYLCRNCAYRFSC